MGQLTARNEMENKMEDLAKTIGSSNLDRVIHSCTDKPQELRLFAVWCARQVQYLLTEKASIDAIDVAEKYSHGLATRRELSKAWKKSLFFTALDGKTPEKPLRDAFSAIAKNWTRPITAIRAASRVYDASCYMMDARREAADAANNTTFEVDADGKSATTAAFCSALSMVDALSYVAASEALLLGENPDEACEERWNAVRENQETEFLRIMGQR